MHRPCPRCLEKKAMIRRLLTQIRQLNERIECGEQVNELLHKEIDELNQTLDGLARKLKK